MQLLAALEHTFVVPVCRQEDSSVVEEPEAGLYEHGEAPGVSGVVLELGEVERRRPYLPLKG